MQFIRKPDLYSDRMVLGLADEFDEMEANWSELTSVQLARIGGQLAKLLDLCELYWNCESVTTDQLELVVTALLCAESFSSDFLNTRIRLCVYTQALGTAKNMNDTFAVMSFSKMVGRAKCEAGNASEGLKHYRNALDLIPEIDEEPDELEEEACQIQAAMATAYGQLGQWEMASKSMSEAIAKIEPENPVLSGHWDAFGTLAHRFGKLEEAREYYEKAIEIAKLYNRLDEVAMASANLAGVLSDQGDAEKSFQLTSEALTVARQQASCTTEQRNFLLEEIFTRLINLASINVDLGEFNNAMVCANEAVVIARDEIGDPLMHAEALIEIGECHFELDENLEALGQLEIAKAIYLEQEDARGLAVALMVEGRILVELSRWEEGADALQIAIKHAKVIDDINLVAGAEFHLAMAQFGLGEREDARIAAERAIRICVSLKHSMLQEILDWVSENIGPDIASEMKQRFPTTNTTRHDTNDKIEQAT